MFMSSDLMINCPYLQFEIMDSHYINFCRIKCFVYGKLRPLCLFFIRFTSEEPSVVFARKQPSDDKQWFDLQHRRGVSPHLLLYLQNHQPHASTSTNSVCFTRSVKFADINCPEQSRHIRSRTSPLLQQSSHHVKWLLPLAHQKNDKRSSDCVLLCQKQTEHMARFCKHFTVDFRFGAECSKGISLEL